MNLLDSPLGYAVCSNLMRGIAQSLFSLKVIGREKLIDDGPCVVVANHQSFLDPPMIGSLFYNPIYYLARKQLFNNPLFGALIRSCNAFPVNQEEADPGSLLKLMRLVRGGNRVLLFPEGGRTRTGDFQEPMNGIGLILSKLATVPVQPIRIHGAYEAWPIHGRLRFRPVTISVGDPIPFTPAELRVRGRAAQHALAQKVMAAIRALPVTA